MRIKDFTIKRRGSGNNISGRFDSYQSEDFYDDWESDFSKQILKTEIIPEYPKSIITKNNSPDIPFEYSINPYRGCEHGCVYCYARPNHSYVNLSPGLDFETKIFAKKNATTILEEEFSKKNYKPSSIALGASTDAYQPIEKKLKITRSLLEVFLKWKHPVSIVTKSALILRDLDILASLAKENLLSVFISITSTDPTLASLLEPRAATPEKRFKIVRELRSLDIPVGVMVAPIIPGLNDHEMENILIRSSENGAITAHYVMLRLPYEVKDLFFDWLDRNYPLKKEKIKNLILKTRNGKEYDSEWSTRMTGTGEYADLIRNRFKIAKKRVGLEHPMPIQDKIKFKKLKDPKGQMFLL